MQIFCDDLSFRIREEVGGNGGDIILFGYSVVPEFQVGDMGPVQVVVMNGFEPFFFPVWLVQRHAKYGEVLVPLFLKGRHYIRIFSPAGYTPAGPEIDQYEFPPEIL